MDCFLDKLKINNYYLIIKSIVEDGNFEHIGDIIYVLDKYDKKREMDNIELKKAVCTIIKDLVQEYHFKPVSFLNINQKEYLSLEEALKYLENQWFKTDIREYLLFFERDMKY